MGWDGMECARCEGLTVGEWSLEWEEERRRLKVLIALVSGRRNEVRWGERGLGRALIQSFDGKDWVDAWLSSIIEARVLLR